MADERVTLLEAAERLDVSRRRVAAMVQNGQLPAIRHGWQWFVPAQALREAEHNMWRSPGRPLSQAGAWKLINESLLKDRVESRSELDLLRRRARARAVHKHFYVHPGLLERLRSDERLVLGGRVAAAEAGAPVDVGESLDIYVRAGDLESLIDDYRIREVPEGANLHLHVVAVDTWPFGPSERCVSEQIAWLDLADSQDRAADALLDRLIGGRLSA